MEKKKPGPKRVVSTEEVRDFFIRNMPVRVRSRAKSRAASLGVTLREFTISALEEKTNSPQNPSEST